MHACLEDHVSDVKTAVDSVQGDALVVAHSYAGVPAALAIRRMGSAKQSQVRLAFVGAALPLAGQSVFDTYHPGAVKYLRRLVAGHDGRTIPVFTRKQLEGWGDHGLVGPALARFRSCTSPHPVRTYEDPADVDFAWDFVNEPTYINLTKDTLAVPDQACKHMALVDHDDGHWPMITGPEAFAELLLSLAA